MQLRDLKNIASWLCCCFWSGSPVSVDRFIIDLTLVTNSRITLCIMNMEVLDYRMSTISWRSFRDSYRQQNTNQIKHEENTTTSKCIYMIYLSDPSGKDFDYARVFTPFSTSSMSSSKLLFSKSPSKFEYNCSSTSLILPRFLFLS